GAPAVLFPVLTDLASWRFYQDGGESDAPPRAAMAYRGLGFLHTLATCCGLACLHFTIDSCLIYAGGVLGSLVGEGLDAGLSFLGATLLLLALWLAGVSLFAGLSWIEVMDRIGRFTLNGLDWIKRKVSSERELKAGRELKESRKEVIRE